jgi:hypothetical protein
MFEGDLDPEIAALLGTGTLPPAQDSAAAPREEDGEGGEPELNAGGFPEITKVFEEKPLAVFTDPNYYKGVMSGEGDKAQRVHGILQKYLNTKDPKDKGVFRQQLTTAYWDFLSGIARKAAGNLPDYKKFLLRFGILHPTLLNPEDRAFFAKLVVNNELNQPVYYLDEWFKAVGTGAVRNSTTDEAPAPRSNASVKLQELLDKAQGKKDGARSLLKAKDDERISLEKVFQDRVKDVTDHYPLDVLPDIHSCYTEVQRRLFAELQEIIKNLLKIDHDIDMYLRDYYQAMEDVKTLEVKLREEGASAETDTKAVEKEFDTVRQMHKMTVGRQGNIFPVLVGEYFRCTPNDVAYRENVITMLAKVESIDPGAFCRPYKNRVNRIAPYVVLIPSYGEFGFCWEPFDRFNRATSRGRIALPMYPKSLYAALLAAVGDLRWQVAKEKASYYWMEEGLTGNYYQWFQKMKLKADLKATFIDDYILWMTKESEGIQKLDKEVRGIFWRYMPFSQPLKEKLKERAFAYQELYQRDLNRAMSDGY